MFRPLHDALSVCMDWCFFRLDRLAMCVHYKYIGSHYVTVH